MMNKVIRAMPDTKVLAKVYQLYMVEDQWGSMLISHNQGVTEATVRTNQTMYRADHTVFLKIYFFPSLTLSGVSSMERERLRILRPNSVHRPIDRMLHTVKKVGLRKPFLPFR